MDLTARGEMDQAIDALESALAREPDLLLARTYLALAYFERGRYAQAVDQCNEILARAPRSAASSRHPSVCAARAARVQSKVISNRTVGKPIASSL